MLPRILPDMHRRIAQQVDGDVRTPGAQLPALDGDDRRARHEQGDHGDPDDRADHEGDRGVDGGEDESDHRSCDRGAHHDPEGRTEPFAIAAGSDVVRCLLHYPHWVTETVDVPIIASDVPVYAHPGDAGADLVAAEAIRLEPGQRAMVGTGVRIALPEGYVAFVVPRSGLAAKHGITVVNAPGTVDAGYRGEIKVILLNTDAEHAHDIAVGDRIAQLIVMPVPRARFIPVEALPESVRGEGGFGSTGFSRGGPAVPPTSLGESTRGAPRDLDEKDGVLA